MSAFRDPADGPKSILLPLVKTNQWTWREIDRRRFVLGRNDNNFFEVRLEGKHPNEDWEIRGLSSLHLIFTNAQIKRVYNGAGQEILVDSEKALLIAQEYIKKWFEKMASEM